MMENEENLRLHLKRSVARQVQRERDVHSTQGWVVQAEINLYGGGGFDNVTTASGLSFDPDKAIEYLLDQMDVIAPLKRWWTDGLRDPEITVETGDVYCASVHVRRVL